MTEELITIVIVNYNSSSFIGLNLFALANLTKNKYKVLICDNGSSWLDRRMLKQAARQYRNVDLFFRRQSAKGSMGHGEALNILIEKIKTPYGVILDADAVLLKKEWDKILIKQLNERVKIIGTPPVQNTKKPMDFPLVYAVIFDTEIFKSLKIDMRPRDISSGLDTGWEMREKFLQSGYRGEVLLVRNTRDYQEGPLRDIICAEFYLEGYESIFASHFGRGSSLGAVKYKELNIFLRLPVLNKVVKIIRMYKEREKWLTVCQKIVENQ